MLSLEVVLTTRGMLLSYSIGVADVDNLLVTFHTSDRVEQILRVFFTFISEYASFFADDDVRPVDLNSMQYLTAFEKSCF